MKNEFFLVIAWVLAIGNVILLGLRIWGMIEYDNSRMRQLLDRHNGIRRVFPVKFPFTLALISIAYLVYYY